MEKLSDQHREAERRREMFKAFIRKRKLSYSLLARRTGVDRSYISKAARGVMPLSARAVTKLVADGGIPLYIAIGLASQDLQRLFELFKAGLSEEKNNLQENSEGGGEVESGE